jgi:type I restriction enzyme S subunit
MYRFRAQEGLVEAEYLEAFLQSSQAQTALDAMKTGISDSGLNLTHGRFYGLPVVLAPLQEQRRIVERLESYSTRLSDAATTLERAQRNLRRYRASVLKDAVGGRLVPTEAELARAEARAYEPASVLLDRILGERRRRWEEDTLAILTARGLVPKDESWKSNYVAPSVPEGGDLPALPAGWCWATLEQLCHSVADGDHQPPPQSSEGIPFLVIGDVKSGCVDLSSARFVSAAYYESLADARRPRANDLLYTVTGSFGIPVRVLSDEPFCVQRHIAILRPSKYSNSGFLYYVLQSQLIFEQARRTATGTAQKTVGLKSLRSFLVPLPPSLEQDRILASLETQFSIADTSASILEASQRRTTRLRQSILKWAFEGRLVDQDPNDEPASVLLERIKAGRQAQTSQPASSRKRRAARTKPNSAS